MTWQAVPSLWPDFERNIALWARTVAGISGANVEMPAPAVLESLLATGAFVRVTNLGGAEDGVTTHPYVTLDTFAMGRNAAWAAAMAIHTALRPRARVGSAMIDSVRANPSPRQLPWSNDKIIRFSATYVLGLRR